VTGHSTLRLPIRLPRVEYTRRRKRGARITEQHFKPPEGVMVRACDSLLEIAAHRCARLCRAAGGELEQIQFLLGHVSVQTTERYIGCTQRISSAVNDRIGIEPTS
jgi:integrase